MPPFSRRGEDDGASRIAWTVGLAAAIAALALLATAGLAQDDDAEVEVLVSDVGRPVDLAVADDGTLWWNAFDEGNVTVYDPDEDTREVVFHAEPLEDPAERGLVGLALDPDHADNGVFYVYYTVPDPEEPEGGTNHLSRIEDGEETRLLEVPARVWHNGGRIAFDDEGRMFVSTGDNKDGHEAQDPSSRLGAILHLHPDGSPAEGNIEGYVHATGFRNVYGLAYDEATDRLFATENGPAVRDEINIVQPGENYGWPHCLGEHRYDYEEGETLAEPCPEEYRDPIGVFNESDTVAPTGATVLDGDLYWTDLKQTAVHRMVEDPDTGEWTDEIVHEASDEIYDVEAHEGDLYYAARGEIARLDMPDALKSIPTQPDEDPAGPEEPDGADGTDGETAITETPHPDAGLAALLVAHAALAARRRR